MTKENEMTTYERRRNVDREWFQDRLDERNMSMRSLAKLMDVDPSTVSLMIRGLRGLNQDNAKKMADIFCCSTNEIYKRAGLPIEDEARLIEVSMYVDRNNTIHEIPEEARDRITAPFDTSMNAFAVQHRTGELHDGWMLIVDGSKLPPSKCVGSMSVFCDHNGRMGAGVIRKGYKADRFNVTHNIIAPEQSDSDLDLLWASPVLWIKPATI